MKRIFLHIAFTVLTFVIGISAFGIFNHFNQSKEQPFQSEELSAVQIPVVESNVSSEQIDNFLDFDDLKIKGIGLGSSEKNLTRRFGKPRKIHHNEFNNCASEEDKTLSYNGLTFGLLQDADSKKWGIDEIEISSSKFQLDSGIKIGDLVEDVVRKVGNNYHEIQESQEIGSTELFYGNGDGWATFSFHKNKLVKISWRYNLC